VAKAEIQMPEDFLKRLSQLGAKSDEIAESVLEAGGEVMESSIRAKLQAVVGRDTKYPSRSTGELERSLGMTKVRVDRDGNHNIKVGFAEPRADGGSNARLANILEYGKHGQPAKPFLKPAKSAAKAACEAAMKQRFDEEVSKLGVHSLI
jgi:HK97 gp10 family phage protein